MRIVIDFQSVKDLSDIEKANELLKILLSNEFVVDKIGSSEPIRDSYDHDEFLKIWKGEHIEGGLSESYVLFKGKSRFKFSGMVIWRKDLPPASQSVNGITIWLTINKFSDYSLLIKLGDQLFKWSEAEYGYISEDSTDQDTSFKENIYNYIATLRWINYFGQSYLNEPNFQIPENGARIHHGIRLNLAETPVNEILRNQEYIESIKREIGVEWFRDYPQKHIRRKPVFDRASITKH